MRLTPNPEGQVSFWKKPRRLALIIAVITTLLTGCKKEDSTPPATCEPSITPGIYKPCEIEQADAIMRKRPLPVPEVDYFSPVAYPQASPMQPAPGAERTLAEILTELNTYLQAEYPTDPQSLQKVLDIFNNATVMAKIPSPTLRAAFAVLPGTIGEPAMSFLQNFKFRSIVFGLPPAGTGIIAQVITEWPTGLITVTFEERFKAEKFGLFTNWIAHELLHQDTSLTPLEEVVIYSVHPMIYAQQLVKHPELALTGTELARRTNSRLLERLQSGTGIKLGLYASNNNQDILPGSPLGYKSWWDHYKTLSNLNPTVGNQQFRDILTKLGIHAPNADFTKETLDAIDLAGNGPLQTPDLVKAMKALGLKVK